MERHRDKTEEKAEKIKETTEGELDTLRNELVRLRELKKQKELSEIEAVQETTSKVESKTPEAEAEIKDEVDEIEKQLEEIDKLLVKQIEEEDQSTYEQHAEYIESQLQSLEEEIIGEKGLIEKELSPYEQLLNDYPWLEETKYEFMYSVPNKKKDPSDYESWRVEWAKVMFDFAKCAILHIIYLKEVISEKPFSNFRNRQEAVKEIAEELVNQQLAKHVSKKKEKIRVYWKSLEFWAHNLYDWAIDIGKAALKQAKQHPMISIQNIKADAHFICPQKRWLQ